ncbi:MAG: tetratricopeptide repeat protein [Cyclobacteriaceae bacterium]|nr:tetratricopeptide repeat protein [Cyclobacteriaceae bacterium]
MVRTAPYELTDFKKDVLADSHHIPVLVDYWASWCGPCKYLGPIVEKLANEANGRWKLVKINTEEHRQLAAEWGIRGIPNLKLFFKGKVIAELSGAMAEPEMRLWIEEKLPSEAKAIAMEASELIAKGQTEEGISLLEKAIEMDDGLNEARLLLAKLIVWKHPERIKELVGHMRHVEEAEELILISNLLETDTDDLREGVSREEVLVAQRSLVALDFETALQMLIKAVSINKRYHNEIARRLTIAVFHILGESNELTKKYRRQFDMALY